MDFDWLIYLMDGIDCIWLMDWWILIDWFIWWMGLIVVDWWMDLPGRLIVVDWWIDLIDGWIDCGWLIDCGSGWSGGRERRTEENGNFIRKLFPTATGLFIVGVIWFNLDLHVVRLSCWGPAGVLILILILMVYVAGPNLRYKCDGRGVRARGS